MGAALLDSARRPETARAYEAATSRAIECDVFGMPFYRLDGEPFWGQDRLEFLERALES